ncbi:MAG TPA: hypothetical protein VNX67_05135 [Solirubrobacteraceae bacterium]|nr:hypothetical protein [Solirubrobacteraceae bacterium]
MNPERHTTQQPQPRRQIRLREVTLSPEARDRAPWTAEDPLKCVWSGYPAYERNCRSRIPLSIVVKAWQRERLLKETIEGFFYFSWRSGVWLGFGAKDGSVRGVYCPTHCSERNARETTQRDVQGEVAGEAQPRA